MAHSSVGLRSATPSRAFVLVYPDHSVSVALVTNLTFATCEEATKSHPLDWMRSRLDSRKFRRASPQLMATSTRPSWTALPREPDLATI